MDNNTEPITYLSLGFNEFFNRVPQKSDKNPYDYRGFYEWEDYATQGSIPQVTQQDAATMFQGIPGNTISGGLIQSQDGALSINLDQGGITYNDGAVDLLSIGGANKNVNINNSSNSSILSSS